MTQVERIIQGLLILQRIDPYIEIVQTKNGIGGTLGVSALAIEWNDRLLWLGWQTTGYWWTFEMETYE